MQREHEALEQALAGLTSAQLTQVSRATGWSIRDVVAHLWEWEQMCLGWYKAGLRGQAPAVPAEGFNWAQLPALNQQIFEKHHARPVADVLKAFRQSYRQMLKTVTALSEAGLFTPGRYAWTRKNTPDAYFVSATSSHYHWARKEIRKCLKD
jgi:uncharacterized protein (TIGR03083 family)